MKNEKETLELISRYETITLGKIKDAWKSSGKFTASKLTGFGESCSCILCKAIDYDGGSSNCIGCFWYHVSTIPRSYEPCHGGYASDTYYRIFTANTPHKLYNAFHARAKFMREVHKKWKEKQ